DSVEDQLKKSRYKEMPNVDYEGIELGFDPRIKADEFEAIARDIDHELGDDAIGRIMSTTALEYRDVVQMLASRGTPAFYAFSRKLYGSPKDPFPDGKTTARDLGPLLYEILTNVDDNMLGAQFARTINADAAVTILNERFAAYFANTDLCFSADDSIVADAAAGNDYVKIRTGAMFSPRDIDILEVH